MSAAPHLIAGHCAAAGQRGWRLRHWQSSWRQLACWWLVATLAAAAEGDAPSPLATAGSEHAAVVHALVAVARGDSQPLLALPGHLISEAPAIVDPQDAALARRWTTLLPQTIARLPPARQAPVLAALDDFYLQATALGAVQPWDYLPAPTASRAVAQAAARAFDHGQLRLALSLVDDGAQAAAARDLLNQPLPRPALPTASRRQAAGPNLLQHGDGWLFGLDPAGRVRWQRRCERQAQVVIGDNTAVIVETAGAAVIDGDGQARPLPPLPSFAKPWAVSERCVWFVAGTRAWRVVLGATLLVTDLTLPAVPLGPPLLRGDDAWWLTRESLVMTHDAIIAERLPHLLHLSPLATVVAHAYGGEIHDGQETWFLAYRDLAPRLLQGEAWLLAGEPSTAMRFADATSDAGREMLFRCALAQPAGTTATFLAAATTPQQQVSAWLASARLGDDASANAALSELARQAPTLFATDSHTNLALPLSAWPLHTTLRAWAMCDDVQTPQINFSSDARQVQVRATWPDATRWWQRTWPTRPLLDAPSRSWALNGQMLVIADGADHLLALTAATGDLLVDAEVPSDLDPAQVVRCGATRVALLSDQGRTLIIVTGSNVQRTPLAEAGHSLSGQDHAVIVVTASGEQRVALP